ncbi:hypothetical protein RvY_18247 [Ramazzottius varieornatus]|uniref:Uncharacterized protein n=1 Tax=Ramazzottius varieornatus TaxID=947166 RepID=A0A1D1W562_RAMVA|nr:hypothetical protein RvY_18247 [Ramazzottius varieornatus]
MAFCVFVLTESGRNKLGRVAAILNLVLVMLGEYLPLPKTSHLDEGAETLIVRTCRLTGLTIVGLSLFIRARIQTKLHLLDNYSGDAFVYFLAVTGVMIALVHAVGVKICLDLGFHASRYRWESLTRLFGLIVLVISVIAFSAVIVVFTHQLTMKKYFQVQIKIKTTLSLDTE